MAHDTSRVGDILRAANKIFLYIAGISRAEFMRSDRTRDLVVLQLVVLGEAVAKLSPEFKLHHDSIEWREFVSIRNIVAHQYMSVDYDLVWDLVKGRVPELARYLRKIGPGKKPPRQPGKKVAALTGVKQTRRR